MKRIIVTGGAGFIGSHVCDYLLEKGNDVLAIDNFWTGKLDNLAEFVSRGGSVHNVDVRSHDEIINIFMNFKPDAVVHLAAQASISTSQLNPVQDLAINGIGVLSIINACLRFRVRNLIYSSTSAVYEETNSSLHESSSISPSSPYGVSKYAAELYVRSMIKNHVIFRFANIYGPRQQPIGTNQLIPRAIRHFKYGDNFCVFGDGKQKRDYLYVKDVAEAISSALSDEIGGTFNLGSGVSTSTNDILGILERVYDVVGYPWEHVQQRDLRQTVKMNTHSVYSAYNWRARTSLIEGIRCVKQWWDSQP